MQSRWAVRLISLVGVLGLALPLSAGEVAIDAGSGVVDSQMAVSFWPSDRPESSKVLDPEGFEAHLVPTEDPDQELTYPCGRWVLPPPGRYKVWIEGQGKVSPSATTFVYRGGPFEGRGAVLVAPVVPAGEVGLGSGLELAAAQSLRIVHTTSHNSGPRPLRELSRRILGPSPVRTVLMPEGAVFGGIYDAGKREYLALARPVEVRPGKIAAIVPRPPASGADLLAILERPALRAEHGEPDVKLAAATSDGTRRSPDVAISTADRVYGIWYGLEGTAVRLEAASPDLFLPAHGVKLRTGKVETFRGTLQPLPSVGVELDLPEGFPVRAMELEVIASSTGRELRRQRVDSAATMQKLDRLPAQPLDIVLVAPPWVLTERVDLRDGRDRSVRFAPQPIRVTGTVYRGRSGYPAEVSFLASSRRHELTTETDEAGRYEAVLFRPGVFMAFVRPRGIAGPPFIQGLSEPIVESRTLDFHLPANDYRVRVVDAETGDPVAGAKVQAFNEFAGEGRVSQPATTDAAGVAQLQPLRPGTLTVQVTADRYTPSPEIEERVLEHEARRELVVKLEPVRDTVRLRLHLAEGRPAAGAEVRAQATLADGAALWSGGSDAAGVVEVPESARGALLLIRHPQAGAFVARWDASNGGDDAEWRLPPAAASPLVIRVLRRTGEPAPWSSVAVWLGELRLTGVNLAWLTWSPVGATNADGLFVARNLPAAPTQALAWSAESAPRAAAGLLDAQGEAISYPWSGGVDLQVAE